MKCQNNSVTGCRGIATQRKGQIGRLNEFSLLFSSLKQFSEFSKKLYRKYILQDTKFERL